MKKILFVSVLAAASVLSFSCNKENAEGGAENETAYFAPQSVISASSKAATKTVLSGTAIHWAQGDAISLFGASGKAYTYTLASGEGSTEGSFEIAETPAEEMTAYALYPASASDLNDGTVSVTVDADQTYAPDGFSAGYPMAAKTVDGTNYLFDNLATVLSLPLKGDMAVSTIKIESVDGQGIAGAATVDFSSGTPVLSATESAASSVTLNCNGTQLSDKETVFNFILIPGDYKEGFKITVLNAEGKGPVKFTPTNISLKPGTIKAFGSAMDAYNVPQDFIFYSSELGWGNSWIDMTDSHGLYSCKNVMLPAFDTSNNEGFRIRFSIDDSQNFGGPVYVNYGAQMTVGGANMSVPEAGRYDIYVDQLDYDKKYIYVMEPGKTPGFGVVGDIVEVDGWNAANAIPMEMKNGYFVAENIKAADGDRFKIVLDTRWDKYNLGGEGQDIPVSVNGKDGATMINSEYSKNIYISGLGEAQTCNIWFDLGAKKVWVITDDRTPDEL